MVPDDTLWSSERLEAEDSAAKPLAEVVDHIRKSGFTRAFPPALLKRIADTGTSRANSSPSSPPFSVAGAAELNAISTIIGYSQTPRLIESTGRSKHYAPLLESILQRVGTRLQYEAQESDHASPLTEFFARDADVMRDLLFIYYETDCSRKWAISQDIKTSLQAATLRVLNRFHLSIVGKLTETRTSEKPNEAPNVPDKNLLSLLWALADYVTFQSPFKDGMTLESRLNIVYRSPASDAILQYLPPEKEVTLFISNTWKSECSRKKDPFTIDPVDTNGAFGAAMRTMTHASACAWVCAPSLHFPGSMQLYTLKQQKAHVRKLRKLGKKANDMHKILKVNDGTGDSHHEEGNFPPANMLEGTRSSLLGRLRFRLAARAFMRSGNAESRKLLQLKHVNRQIAAVGLGVESGAWIEELGTAGMFKELRSFSERAAEEVPDVSNTDGERQAVRNLWACFGLETILFQQRPHYNDAIFGFSMIYPKTDNFLDSNDVSREEKIAFQKAFHKRIRGDPVPDVEGSSTLKQVLADVSDLIGLIEKRWPRDQHPYLYTSALALNTSQTVSLAYQRAKKNVRRDSFEIALYKGGVTVVSDAFLVNGDITLREAGFSFVLGTCLQMMDDLQDVSEDMANNHDTLFTRMPDVDPTKQALMADANGRRLFWFLCQIWASQEGKTDQMKTETKLQRSASQQRNEVVIKTSLRISQMMALKYLFRGQSVFTKALLQDAAKRCTVEPTAMLKLRGITFLHKMAKMDYI